MYENASRNALNSRLVVKNLNKSSPPYPALVLYFDVSLVAESTFKPGKPWAWLHKKMPKITATRLFHRYRRLLMLSPV